MLAGYVTKFPCNPPNGTLSILYSCHESVEFLNNVPFLRNRTSFAFKAIFIPSILLPPVLYVYHMIHLLYYWLLCIWGCCNLLGQCICLYIYFVLLCGLNVAIWSTVSTVFACISPRSKVAIMVTQRHTMFYISINNPRQSCKV